MRNRKKIGCLFLALLMVCFMGVCGLTACDNEDSSSSKTSVRYDGDDDGEWTPNY